MDLRKSLVTQILSNLTEAQERLSQENIVTWGENNFYIPETLNDPEFEGRINLIQYQRDCLEEIFAKDDNGLWKYSVVVWSDIKKSGKSTIAALASLYIADQMPWAENYHIANDLKQANERVGHYARRAVVLSPYLKERFKAVGYKIKHLHNGSHIQSIPIDPSGEAGSNAELIQFSEMWGSIEEAKSRMWSEMTLAPIKFGRSLRWIESYAGFTEESETLYGLWETGVKNGELIWPERKYPVTDGEPTVLEAYKNDDARMFCLWNTQPRCPWQTPAYYKSEAAILLPSEFDRMHRNKWSSNTDTFVPIEWWDACKRKEVPPPYDGQGTIVSLDAAVSNDTFGVLQIYRHPDREQYPNDLCMGFAQRWEPPKRGGMNFDLPETELRRLIKEFNVVEVAYDEYQLYDLASRFKKEGLAYFRRFPQGGGKHSRLISDSMLRDLIREKRIWHDGNPHVREHLQNANAKVDDEDRKVRIVKRVEKLKIDLAVCLSMACYEAFRLNI